MISLNTGESIGNTPVTSWSTIGKHVIYKAYCQIKFKKKMGAAALPFIVFTVLWGAVGGVAPFFVPKGPNKGIIQVLLVLTGVCCWLFWLCCYVVQMNPLIGPRIERETVLILARQWGNPIVEG